MFYKSGALLLLCCFSSSTHRVVGWEACCWAQSRWESGVSISARWFISQHPSDHPRLTAT